MGTRMRNIALVAISIWMALQRSAAAGIDETYVRPGPSIWSSDYYARMIGRNAFGKSVAVLVGVGDYDRFGKLSAPAGDALRVRDFLRDEAGFDQIITLTDEKATYARINELMETRIPSLLGENDRFFFYFSGHGVTRQLSRTKRGYLVLKNSGPGMWQDMVDMERMKQWTENIAHARHALFLLDACFSGLAAIEAKTGDVQARTLARLMQPGHHIVTAGAEGEETFIYKQESLFTQAFLSAARGEGMTPQDGIVSLNEMMARVNRILDAKQTEIGDKIRMTPRHYHSRVTNNAGEFFFLPQARRAPSDSASRPKPESEQPVPKGPEIVALYNRAMADRFDRRVGVEAQGMSIGNSPTARSISECEYLCANRPTCGAYTFNKIASICYLYARAEFVPSANYDSGLRGSDISIQPPGISSRPGQQSGQSVPPGSETAAFSAQRSATGFSRTKDAEAKGMSIGNSPLAGSVTECEQLCTARPGCRTYTFNKIAGICYFYSRADLVPSASYDSGTRP